LTCGLAPLQDKGKFELWWHQDCGSNVTIHASNLPELSKGDAICLPLFLRKNLNIIISIRTRTFHLTHNFFDLMLELVAKDSAAFVLLKAAA